MALVFLLLKTIVVLVIGYLLVRLVQFWKYARRINKIPGPKCVPFFGNLLEFLVPFEDLMNAIFDIGKKQQEAGRSVVRFWFGSWTKVAILKGSACEVILKSSKYVNKSKEYSFLKEVLGDGILTSKKELWEKRRKMINPSFHLSVLKQFFPIVNEQVAICLQQLEKVEDGGPFNIVPYFHNLSLDIVCESTLGVSVNAQEDSSTDVVRSHHEYGDIFCMRIFNPLMSSSFLYNFTSYKRQGVKCSNIIRSNALKVIRERVQFLERSKLQQNGVKVADESEVYGQKRRIATLDLLIEATCDGQKLTDSELVDEITLIIAAGLQTTSGAMSFTLFLLGWHPEVQKLVQQEVDRVIGESDRPVTCDDLLRLKYLDAVLKESMRVYPPVPLVAREMDEDVVVDGHTIPAGTTVALMIYNIHHDPAVFPEPDKFDPERFLSAKTNMLGTYDYMPFLQGPRNCLGKKLGIFEAKVLLVYILRKYDIISHDRPETLKLAFSPDLRSHHGIKVSLQKRK